MTLQDFQLLPLMRRRLVSFVDEEAYLAIIAAGQDPAEETLEAVAESAAVPSAVAPCAADDTSPEPQGGRWNAVSKWGLKATQTTLSGAGTLLTGIKDLAAGAVSAYQESKRNGLGVTFVPAALATHLVLPPNHPREKTLYAAHPVSPLQYVPVSDFHRFTFNHKFAELITLLAHLGAVRITGEHVQGYSQGFLASASGTTVSAGVPLPPVGGHIAKETASAEKIVFEAELEGNDRPALPPGLAWFEHEPSWQAIAEARMQFGLKKFEVGLTYTDDYSINAGLQAKMQGAGFDVSGNFESHTSTVWTFTGTFTPLRRRFPFLR